MRFVTSQRFENSTTPTKYNKTEFKDMKPCNKTKWIKYGEGKYHNHTLDNFYCLGEDLKDEVILGDYYSSQFDYV